MKVNRLETHDRFLAFKENQLPVGKFIQDMIDTLPFGKRPFYIFIIHKRTLGIDEKLSLIKDKIYSNYDDMPEAMMFLQARLSRPQADPNTTLLKVYPGKDDCKRIWSLPQIETWEQFEKGKMFEDEFILESIIKHKTDKKNLEKLDEDDPHTVEEFNFLRKISEKKRTVCWIPIFSAKENKILNT